MKTERLKNQPQQEQLFRVCGCCKKELPLEAFYLNRRTQLPENYCKECRKENSRKHRGIALMDDLCRKGAQRTLITKEKDAARRMELILEALAKVAESVRRKRERDLNEELELWDE